MWSTHFDFWQCVDVVVLSGEFTTLLVPLQSSSEVRNDRLRFLDGLKRDAEDRAWLPNEGADSIGAEL